MKIVVLIATCSFATGALAADHIIGPAVQTCFMESKHVNDPRVILPGIYNVCAAEGIPKDKCIKDSKYLLTDVQSYAMRQTDPALWYNSESGRPDNGVPPPDSECHGAVPISHYYTMDGTLGTNYYCLEPPSDDQITPAELAVFKRFAEHSNSIGKKTLQDHEMALQVKQMAHWLATQ